MAAAEAAADVMAIFCMDLPKIELHAHLHGSISEKTIDRLLAEYSKQSDPGDHNDNGDSNNVESQVRQELKHNNTFKHGDRTLEECFEVFNVLHRVVNCPQVLYDVTREVVRDFVSDRVIYAELRSTPRPVCASSSKEEYVVTITRAINDELKQQREAFDRASLAEAMDTVRLASRFAKSSESKCPVVGLDFSGNPNVGGFDDFLPAFKLAREHGLCTTVHTAETRDAVDTQTIVAKFRPNRLGHAVCLPEATIEHLLHLAPRERIPIEICPTSNVKTRAVETMKAHPFGRFVTAGYPVCLCTDDSGVFNITLSSEYYRMARAFDLSHDDLRRLSRLSIQYAFVSDSVKAAIENIFDRLL